MTNKKEMISWLWDYLLVTTPTRAGNLIKSLSFICNFELGFLLTF